MLEYFSFRPSYLVSCWVWISVCFPGMSLSSLEGFHCNIRDGRRCNSRLFKLCTPLIYKLLTVSTPNLLLALSKTEIWISRLTSLEQCLTCNSLLGHEDGYALDGQWKWLVSKYFDFVLIAKCWHHWLITNHQRSWIMFVNNIIPRSSLNHIFIPVFMMWLVILVKK